MTIITIQNEHPQYGIGSKCYMSEYICWADIIKVLDEDSKYWVRFLQVDKK